MSVKSLLEISNLSVAIKAKPKKAVLNKLSLTINSGEVHAIMGPNGAGKSTLAKTLLGHPEIIVTKGKVTYNGNDLLVLRTDERATRGLFMAFQQPVGIPGITIGNVIRTAINAQRTARKDLPISVSEFLREIKGHLSRLKLTTEFLDRELNVDLSGGEKKKVEILQLLMLQPVLAILDETDSGLDIDALKAVGKGIASFRCAKNAVLIITHYPRILKEIKPNKIHIMLGGKIVKSGDIRLAEKIEKQGFDWLKIPKK